MDEFSFVFTIFFMLLGPVKLIAPFASLTAERDDQFQRTVALYATAVTAGVFIFVAIVGTGLLDRYRISTEALAIAAGIVLLVAALNTMFDKNPPPQKVEQDATPIHLAVYPLALPTIVPPAGVAAILIFMMEAPQFPGIETAVAISLAIILLLNLIVMFFNRTILKAPGLLLGLRVVGSVLVFMQVALAVDSIVGALSSLGFIAGK